MTPRDRDERQFAEDIDRLLRGEEPLNIQDDADYVETLQFAHRLMQLGDEPGEEFAGKLRHRLAVELAAQDAEKEASGSWFVRVFSRPSLRLAVVSTFIVLAAVGLVWRAGLLSPMVSEPEDPGPGIMTTPAPSEPEEADPRAAEEDDASLNMDAVPTTAHDSALTVVGHVPPSVSFGETISITIEFSNEGPEPVSLDFFPPAVHIRAAATGEIVYSFAAGDNGDVIQPMGSRSYSIDWDPQEEGQSQIEAGRYIVEVALVETTVEAEKWVTEMITVAAFNIENTDD